MRGARGSPEPAHIRERRRAESDVIALAYSGPIVCALQAPPGTAGSVWPTGAFRSAILERDAGQRVDDRKCR